MATRARAIGMMFTDAGEETVSHGGDLGIARRLFPGAPEPFIDLSTGINPQSYPLARFSPTALARLPEQDALTAIAAAAAKAYCAPSAEHVVVAPGSQILLSLVASLVPPARAAVVSPTYPELARAAALTPASSPMLTIPTAGVRRARRCSNSRAICAGAAVFSSSMKRSWRLRRRVKASLPTLQAAMLLFCG